MPSYLSKPKQESPEVSIKPSEKTPGSKIFQFAQMVLKLNRPCLGRRLFARRLFTTFFLHLQEEITGFAREGLYKQG